MMFNKCKTKGELWAAYDEAEAPLWAAYQAQLKILEVE